MRKPDLVTLGVSLLAILLAGCANKDAEPSTDQADTDQTEVAAVEDETAALEAMLIEAKAASEEALARATASRGEGEPALWTLKDEDTTVYMLGTVHLLRPGQEWMSADIKHALDTADTLVFETDVLSQEGLRDIMAFTAEHAFFKDGTRLNDLMNDAEEAVVQKALTDAGLSLELVQTMQPWYAMITLEQMRMMSDGFDPEAGVEMQISAYAKDSKRAFLETPEEQLGGLVGLSHEDQVDFLVLSAGLNADSGELLDKLVAEWADGDVEGLAILVASEEAFGDVDVYDAMLRDRNARWVPQIKAMLDEPGTRVVAVGAGHLAGDDSVVEMLRADGLTVEGP